MLSGRSRASSVATLLALGAFAFPWSSPAASSLPNKLISTGVDGHWTRLFDDMPWNNRGTLLWDPVHQRVTLGGMLELDLTRPNIWTKIDGSSGLYEGLRSIDDPIGDRLLAIASWPVVDSLQVHALPLSSMGSKYVLPSVNSPAGLEWGGFTQTFDVASNAVTLFGGLGTDPAFHVHNYRDWICRVALGSGNAVFGPVTSPVGGPAARAFHSTITDLTRQHMVVFGGQNQFTEFNDVKIGSMDGASWTSPVISGTPPTIRSDHDAIYDPVRDRMVVFGGKGLNDLWQLTLSNPMTWSPLAVPGGPPAPVFHAGTAVYDPRVDRMIVYGADDMDQMWSLTLTPPLTWTDHTIPHPGVDTYRAVFTDPVRRSMFFYGRDGIPYDLSFDTMTWSIRPSPFVTGPSKRWGAIGAYDTGRQKVVLYGGVRVSDSVFLTEVWTIGSGAAPFWAQVYPAGPTPSPFPRSNAIYDPVRERLIFMGQRVGDPNRSNDVWALTLSGSPTWAMLAPTGTPPPSPRTFSAAVYDPVRDRILYIASSTDVQVWALSLGGTPAWEQLPPCPEPGAIYGGAAYDPVLDRVLVFTMSKLYELRLSGTPTWRLLAPTGTLPIGGAGADLAYDASTDRFFVLPSEVTEDTYVLEFGARLDVPVRGAPGAQLAPCAPNPVERGTTLRFNLVKAGPARFAIYDVSGRLVTLLASGLQAAGPHEIEWDGRTASGARVTPGVYLYTLEWEGARIARRMAVVR